MSKNVKIFAKTIEKEALNQINELSEFDAYKDSKIRIMPDVHAGAGCTIGTTMEIKDKITPNLVGVDIGCGMLTIELKEREIDFPSFDKVIYDYIPNGFNIHDEQKEIFHFEDLISENFLDIERAKLSLGTLGGGNHFIELDKDKDGKIYLVIHSGSRNIGGQVAKHYQDIAISRMTDTSTEKKKLIERLKKEGRERDISKELKKIKRPVVKKDLAYLEGEDFKHYIHDVSVMQNYASVNRRVMANIILEKSGLTEVSSFETIHNYIDMNRMILRKGAISAEKDELVLIPINMRDGSIIAKGKGNKDWNYSAPHGGGRLMSRTKAKENISIDVFKQQMFDIYSTSVVPETLDEAPDAYKPIEEILEVIDDTVEIISIIKPIYNFKSH